MTYPLSFAQATAEGELGQPVALDSAAMPACERILHIREARLTRRLVICDGAGRRTIIDSERFVSWVAQQRVCCFTGSG